MNIIVSSIPAWSCHNDQCQFTGSLYLFQLSKQLIRLFTCICLIWEGKSSFNFFLAELAVIFIWCDSHIFFIFFQAFLSYFKQGILSCCQLVRALLNFSFWCNDKLDAFSTYLVFLVWFGCLVDEQAWKSPHHLASLLPFKFSVLDTYTRNTWIVSFILCFHKTLMFVCFIDFFCFLFLSCCCCCCRHKG